MFHREDLIIRLPDLGAGAPIPGEIPELLLLGVLVLAELLLCLQGWKYFRTLGVAVLSALWAGFWIRATGGRVENPLIAMSLFVMALFGAVMVLYGLSLVLRRGLGRLVPAPAWGKLRAVAGAALGSGALGLTVYRRICRCGSFCLVLALTLGVLSGIRGWRRARNQRPFYTYEDLRRQKILVKPYD